MNQELYDKIKELARVYASQLQRQVELRENEMKQDDRSHYLIYRVLGVSDREGDLVDLYQNKGRFLYKYAGAFLEEATVACFKEKFPDASKKRITNSSGTRPKTFEIDCLVGKLAHEIKWRDATTDGDHITKEYAKIKAISEQGYVPIRVMFYYPQRSQAQRIQEALQTLYDGIGGQYYYGDSAWRYVREFAGVDLFQILNQIAESRNQ